MEVHAIAAVADDGTIGNDGEIPWHRPDDLERFRNITTDCALVMGRVTYESILERNSRPLTDAGRTVIVLSTTMDPPEWDGVMVARTPGDAIRVATRYTNADRVIVAGGASVYEDMLPLCSRLYLTRVHEEPDGDTRFPDLRESVWSEVSRELADGMTFIEYEAKR